MRRWASGIARTEGKKALRRTKALMQRQSLVPPTPIIAPGSFAFEAEFEANWRPIRAELEALLDRWEALPQIDEIEPGQGIGSDKWRTFWLMGFGQASEANCARCPETARLLGRVPGIQTAMFSIMEGGTYVPPHKGITAGLLRAHLGLIVPEKKEECRMTLADGSFHWEEGRVVVFDDTWQHSVRNDTDQLRAVLLIDFQRPMRPLGRFVHHGTMGLFRRSAMYRTGVANQEAWEEAYYAAEGLP